MRAQGGAGRAYICYWLQKVKNFPAALILQLGESIPALIQKRNQLSVGDLLRCGGWPTQQRHGPIPYNLKIHLKLEPASIHSLIIGLTRLPHRDIICSRDVTIPFATALESHGSNFAASSSFATALPTAMPSAIPGGLRMPPENTWPIASLTRLEHRVRNEVSNTESDRRTKIVSGLWILSAESHGNRS